jgi:hypothetical protein
MERMPNQEDKLDGLFAAYRDACFDPDAGPDFMPNLWQKIEARRIDTTSIFQRLAHLCMAATAAVLLLTVLMTPVVQDDEVLYSSTYADLLAEDHADAAYQETLSADVLGEAR